MNSLFSITLNIFPALNGDSILVSYGPNEKKHILIDCGYVRTYNTFIKKELVEIANNGECLEKLIITHIDSDHIWGALPLLKDNQKKFIEIKEVWHNTFRHLSNDSEKEEDISNKNEKILKKILSRGYFNNEPKNGENQISAEQGTTLGALLLKGDYSWNNDFNKKAVCIENKQTVNIDIDSQITLLSPNKEKLDNLKTLWDSELTKYDLKYSKEDGELYDDAFEMLLTWVKESQAKGIQAISSNKMQIKELLASVPIEDKTPTNGSSISFILKIKEKKLLFLADSHPGLILKSLLEYQPEGIINFDSIKVSHHGSFNNISLDLLEKIDSKVYIFSTNGNKHNHPDKETIAHIVGRKSEFERKLFFNYKTLNSEYFNNEDWMKTYNYSIHYLNQDNYKINV
jgi:beta-lactamase superfamily II metal-dependent hydrolase